MVYYGGINPSGSPRRPSGVAIVDEEKVVSAKIVYSDEDIIMFFQTYKPVVIAIDSPLSHTEHGYREVDLAMKRMGYPVLPPSWPSMRKLIERSLRIVANLRNMGITVIETHPKSALKSSGCRDPKELFSRVFKYTPSIDYRQKDLVDAIIASIVAMYYVKGGSVVVRACDGEIYLLPKIC